MNFKVGDKVRYMGKMNDIINCGDVGIITLIDHQNFVSVCVCFGILIYEANVLNLEAVEPELKTYDTVMAWNKDKRDAVEAIYSERNRRAPQNVGSS